jgi:hypothetical protein
VISERSADRSSQGGKFIHPASPRGDHRPLRLAENAHRDGSGATTLVSSACPSSRTARTRSPACHLRSTASTRISRFSWPSYAVSRMSEPGPRGGDPPSLGWEPRSGIPLWHRLLAQASNTVWPCSRGSSRWVTLSRPRRMLLCSPIMPPIVHRDAFGLPRIARYRIADPTRLSPRSSSPRNSTSRQTTSPT